MEAEKIPRDHILLTWTDPSNITRCHVVRKSFFQSVPNNRFSFGRFVFAFPFMGGAPVAGTVGQVNFHPDTENALLPVPWLPGAKICFGKFYEDNGNPFSFCPRTFLYEQEKKMKAANFKLVVGFELEFFLLNQDGSPIENTGYSEMKALRGQTWKILTKIIAGIEACGIPIWRYHAEGSPGQLEIAIGPFKTSLINAADALVLARQAIYQIAAEYGLIATFGPKPFPDLGTGAHTHISIENAQDENLFLVAPKDANAILAGIFKNLPNNMLILAPTANSYDRLKPTNCCGAYHCIGEESRLAAIRLIKNEHKIIQRFELRPVDGTANPYLLLGAMIGAGLDGLKQQFSLPREIEKHPFEVPETERPPCLPSSLEDAIRLFENSKFNEEFYGKELHQLIVKLRTQEMEYWKSADSMESKMEKMLRMY